MLLLVLQIRAVVVGQTLEDLARRAEMVAAQMTWLIKEVILAGRATHAWGRLQKEIATHRLTTSHLNQAISRPMGVPEVVVTRLLMVTKLVFYRLLI